MSTTFHKNGSGKLGKFLYLVSAPDFGGYDTFDSFVGCADSEQEVREMHPDGILDDNDKGVNFNKKYGTWVMFEEIDRLEVELIGIAKNQVKGVILSSFNAGYSGTF